LVAGLFLYANDSARLSRDRPRGNSLSNFLFLEKGNPMNQLSISRLLLATCITAATAVVGHAQGVHASQLLPGGSSCLHVISLIQLHGVNNSFDTGGTHLTAHHGPFGSYAVPDTELGDLEIVQIAQEAHVDPACGPKFIVTIRNNSCRDVCNFHVTVVATLGRIFPGSPNSSECVDTICAGATADVCVQLPVEALAMGNHNGQVIGFQKIIVAIDAFDELAETNEANNLKAFACGEIPVAAAAVVEEGEATVVTESLESLSATAPTAAPTFAPAAPQPPAAVAPTEDEEPATDALRSAIRMMDEPGQEGNTAIAGQ
jgi:hypothetical protein